MSLSTDEERWSRSRVAEAFVRDLVGGILSTQRQDVEGKWDVMTPSGEKLDVKSVKPGYRYVIGGDIDHRPVWRSIVVEVSDDQSCRLLGQVRMAADWHRGDPLGKLCWYVEVAELAPWSYRIALPWED